MCSGQAKISAETRILQWNWRNLSTTDRASPRKRTSLASLKRTMRSSSSWYLASSRRIDLILFSLKLIQVSPRPSTRNSKPRPRTEFSSSRSPAVSWVLYVSRRGGSSTKPNDVPNSMADWCIDSRIETMPSIDFEVSLVNFTLTVSFLFKKEAAKENWLIIA